LSVILRSRNLNVQPSAGRWLHYFEGSSRIAAGVVSGLIVSLAIKTELILASLAPDQPKSMMILAAMAAGASERFATSIIAQIDSGHKKETANKEEKSGTINNERKGSTKDQKGARNDQPPCQERKTEQSSLRQETRQCSWWPSRRAAAEVLARGLTAFG